MPRHSESTQAYRRTSAVRTSIDDRKSSLQPSDHKVLCERIVQISNLYGAQSGDARILIRLLHDSVPYRLLLLRTKAVRGAMTAPAMPIAPSSSARGTECVEIGNLRCCHEQDDCVDYDGNSTATAADRSFNCNLMYSAVELWPANRCY